MKQVVVALCAFVASASACGITSPLGPDSTPAAVHIPAAADLDWKGFRVHLDPTVLVWAEQGRVDLRSIVRDALDKIEGHLHGSPVSVSIEAGSFWAIPDVGIGGDTDRRSGAVSVSMDSRSVVPVGQLLSVWLPMAMAHELHHSARILDGPGYGSTLLDAMITEGSAEAFVREIYPDAPARAWVAPLGAGEERDVWQRAQRVLNAPDDINLHQTWFVGGGALPRWPGYRMGYEIVGDYLQRNHATAAGIVKTSAARIFTKSGFAQSMRRTPRRGA